MTDIHPMRLLTRLGISDGPATAAIGITMFLQYIFLVKLWEGYPIRHMGDVIHDNVVITMAALSILGAAAITVLSLRRWTVGANAARRLERPAANQSFDAIRAALVTVATRSTLPSPPALFYTPKNGNALEVRERHSPSHMAVVVGLDQRAHQHRDPAAFAAMLGHEISHLELAAIRAEIVTRRSVFLHFRIFGWLVANFLLVLGFIDRRGLGSAPRFGGFTPVLDSTIYVQLGSQFAALVLSSTIVFVYSYFFVVRREHIHDFRGSQLAQTDALVTVFSTRRADGFLTRVAMALKAFFVLHPHPAARFRVLKRRDLILLSAVLYPAVVSGLEPLILLLAAGWCDFFGVAPNMWNFGLTLASGLFLYAVLRADLARLGLGLLLNPLRYTLLVPVYALVAGIATQIPRIILEILFGLRHGLSSNVILERILAGSIVGGGRIAIMTAILLGSLTCLNAIRIAATGEGNAGESRFVDAALSALIVMGAFAIASLASLLFVLPLLLSCVIVAVLHALWFSATSKCGGCGRRRFSALRFGTQCACGKEQLPILRRWTTQPFEKHAISQLKSVAS